MGGKGEKEWREEGTGRGPQFEKNDPPPSSDGWLQAWRGDDVMSTVFVVGSEENLIC